MRFPLSFFNVERKVEQRNGNQIKDCPPCFEESKKRAGQGRWEKQTFLNAAAKGMKSFEETFARKYILPPFKSAQYTRSAMRKIDIYWDGPKFIVTLIS
jgi:hypothetical protein